jgi:hypothetical protein
MIYYHWKLVNILYSDSKKINHIFLYFIKYKKIYTLTLTYK